MVSKAIVIIGLVAAVLFLPLDPVFRVAFALMAGATVWVMLDDLFGARWKSHDWTRITPEAMMSHLKVMRDNIFTSPSLLPFLLGRGAVTDDSKLKGRN